MISDDGRIFAPPGSRRLCVMREGRAVVREWKIPKPGGAGGYARAATHTGGWNRMDMNVFSSIAMDFSNGRNDDRDR